MTALLTYTLKNQCGGSRPFCRQCANSFTIKSCEPSHCKEPPPSTICLRSKLTFPYVGGDCGACPDDNETMPGGWIVVLAWSDIDGPSGPKAAGSHTFVVPNNGSLIGGTNTCGFHYPSGLDGVSELLLPTYGSEFHEPDEPLSINLHISSGGAIGSVGWNSVAFGHVVEDVFQVFEDMCVLKFPGTGFGDLVADYDRVLTLPNITGPGAAAPNGASITIYPIPPA